MSDVTELIEQLRAHKQRNYRQQTKLDWNAADTLARLQSRIDLLEGVRGAAQRVVDCEPLRKQGHEFPALAVALAAAEDKGVDNSQNPNVFWVIESFNGFMCLGRGPNAAHPYSWVAFTDQRAITFPTEAAALAGRKEMPSWAKVYDQPIREHMWINTNDSSKCIGPLEVITPTGCGTFPVADPVQRSNEELFRREDSK